MRYDSPYPVFGLTAEQRREAVLGNKYEWPGMDGGRGEIWCYTDRYAYRAGELAGYAGSELGRGLRLGDQP